MKKEFLFLNNLDKNGYSFSIIFDKEKVILANEHGEFQCMEPDRLLEMIKCDIIEKKITLICKL